MPRRRPAEPPSDRPLRAVLHRRISQVRGRAGDDFHSPETQLTYLQRAVTGMSVVAVVDDFDESGRKLDRKGLELDRPGLNRIRRMVESGDVDVVAFYNVSRLGRNVLGSLLFVKYLEDRGARILSATEHIDTSTPVGRMMLTNMLAVAQLQSDQIGEAWSKIIAGRAAKGLHHGHPFGYRRVKGRPLEPDPVTGPIAADAFAAYARGEPMGAIARMVSDRRGFGTPTANIKVWFRSPVYLGHVVAAGEVVFRDAHPPLVDEHVWETVQRRLRRDRTEPPRVLAPTWALVGITYCPDGHRLQRVPTVYRGEPVDRLLCGRSSSRGPGHPCAGIGQPRLAPVETEVLRQVAGYIGLLRTDEAARAARAASRAQSSRERSTVDRELDRTRAAMAKLSRAWALGDVPDAGFHTPMAELRAAERELSAQLDGLDAPVVTAPPRALASVGERLLRLWPEATVAERSRLVRLVVRRVVVRKAARWREPEADRVTVDF